MGNVDNVDKKVDYFLLETINCRKYKENRGFLNEMLSVYVNFPKGKNPHALWAEHVDDLVDNVDNLTVLTGFRRFYTHLRPHGYQHVSVDTIF